MAGYVGSTAASTAANPPVVMDSVIGGHIQYSNTGATGSTAPFFGLPNGGMGGKLWFYSSTNLGTDAAAAAFFNDGPALGMTIGDVMIGVYSSAYSTTPYIYLGVLVTSYGSTSFTLSSNIITSTAV